MSPLVRNRRLVLDADSIVEASPGAKSCKRRDRALIGRPHPDCLVCRDLGSIRSCLASRWEWGCVVVRATLVSEAVAEFGGDLGGERYIKLSQQIIVIAAQTICSREC